MKISAAVLNPKDLTVTDRLIEASALAVIDADVMKIVEIIFKESEAERDIYFAKETLRFDCEAIICGRIDKEAFDILADEGVSRYLGTGYDALEAVCMMQKRKLALIRDYDGGVGCAGHALWHSIKEYEGCSCSHHDHQEECGKKA